MTLHTTTRRRFGQLALGSLFVHTTGASAAVVSGGSPVPLQPLSALAQRVAAAMAALGSPLSESEQSRLQAAFRTTNEAEAASGILQVLDARVLLEVRINPEARLSVARGAAPAELIQGGWSTFLVKVLNEAGATSPLLIRSPQAGATGRRSSLAVEGVHDFTNGAVDAAEARARWIALSMYDQPPMTRTLSGLPVDYRILQVYSRDAGQREASLVADAGFGEQDLGFRSTLAVLFRCAPARAVKLHILDEGGRPTTTSLLIRDAQERIYPAQGKRELPDLAFEQQIYRGDGETVLLAPGQYTVDYGRGPEYLRGSVPLAVAGSDTELKLELQRWIDPATSRYYSGDTHIHAAGCSHYESPTEGVPPEVMERQVAGEALSLGAVLNWGPGFHYQRQFFIGHAVAPMEHAQHTALPTTQGRNELALEAGLLRYDVEVSGFPSSHCGHLVLLRLQHDTFPGTTALEEWPSWNLPILRWAKAQGAVTGYAHVGHGLVTASTTLPNYDIPPFNSSGANEFLVDITFPGMVDFISGCDLWPFAELNVWYHTLNCGLRSAFAGETDFPCITDECVGGGRTYARLQHGPPRGDAGYSAWLQALTAGDAYVGDGRSHLFDFKLEAAGAQWRGNGMDRALALATGGEVTVSAQVCARLEATPDARLQAIGKASPYSKPYWHLERARLAGSRQIAVELIVNGSSVQSTKITADGSIQQVRFTYHLQQSSWIALRIHPSSHTNPLWVSIGGAPVRASRRSAAWCREAVDVCWEQKRQRIRQRELAAAASAYAHARAVYDRVMEESPGDAPAPKSNVVPPVFPVT